MAKLDAIEDDGATSSLSHEDIVSLRRRIADSQALIRETVDRLRQVQEENEMLTRRREELEARVASLEAEYEELLGLSTPFALPTCADCPKEKTIHDEETSNADLAESIADLKVCCQYVRPCMTLMMPFRPSSRPSTRPSVTRT